MRGYRYALAGFLTGICVVSSPAMAQDSSPMVQENALPVAEDEASRLEFRTSQIVDVINGKLEPQDVFSDAFLKAVPPPQLDAFTQSLIAQYGPALSAQTAEPRSATRAAIEVRFEHGIGTGAIAVLPDAEGRISELIIRDILPVNDGMEQIIQDLRNLPGQVSAYFGPLDGDAPVLALNADTPLALGSTFKFYVLAALAKDIADGKRQWDDVVPLSVKSFPSGAMQSFPENAPATLHTYASLMMSISDNTATDQLIKVLGRDRVYETFKASAHATPEISAPFLTTRELFLLKGGDKEQLAAYADGMVDDRMAILANLEENPPGEAQVFAAFAGKPVRIDVEWFSSPRDLANLFEFMRLTADPEAFKIMSINKGIGDEYLTRWTYVGHKGGSEPGVRNLTWLLTDADGADYLLTLGWNNPDEDVSTQTLLGFAKRILSQPR